MPPAPMIGDGVVAGATMVLDTRRTVPGHPTDVWPWLLQLGKRRAGWYLPRRVERLLPAGRRALRAIDPELARLDVGDRIPDYGGRDEHLEVVELIPGRALVFGSQRGAARFSWALLLSDTGNGRTGVHLRFRGKPRSTGWRLRVLIAGGGFFDRLTGELLLAGLAERTGGRDAAGRRDGLRAR